MIFRELADDVVKKSVDCSLFDAMRACRLFRDHAVDAYHQAISKDHPTFVDWVMKVQVMPVQETHEKYFMEAWRELSDARRNRVVR